MDKAFQARVENRSVKVGFVGLGYVGLPLILALNQQGFLTIGFDIDPEKPERLLAGHSFVKHIHDSVIESLGASSRFPRIA